MLMLVAILLLQLITSICLEYQNKNLIKRLKELDDDKNAALFDGTASIGMLNFELEPEDFEEDPEATKIMESILEAEKEDSHLGRDEYYEKHKERIHEAYYASQQWRNAIRIAMFRNPKYITKETVKLLEDSKTEIEQERKDKELKKFMHLVHEDEPFEPMKPIPHRFYHEENLD
eukprot:snap_masked-scaffold_62-processed-gene-0.43-mRNA-1 protein AED:1.00 eAED:1.00 QI:0/-1/0/0/-1/1/1/0/174